CKDPRYGDDVVYKGGLRVYTTLDMRLQEVAERELTEQIESLRKQGRIYPAPVGQGALACVNVHNGDVLAMVGGVGEWEQVQFNRAHPGPPQYGRQPGSSFKPYLFATAFESGFSPSSVFSGDPIRIGTWTPVNYSPGQGGDYTLKRALGQSVNLVAVRLIREVGIRKTVRYAARMLNIPEDRLDPYPSLALGVSEISPLEHALGYACFASGGWRPSMRLYHTITDYTGEVIERQRHQPVRVLSKAAAISMIECLRYVVTNGTGRQANIPGVACAGKTGTTQDHHDAWWVGFTPDLSCAVWVGNDNNKPMRRASGGGFAAPVWREFIKQATEILGCDGQYPEGTGVTASREDEQEEEEEEEEETEEAPQVATRSTVCAVSGGLATPYCPDTVERILMPGESPPPPCTIHRRPRGATLEPAREAVASQRQPPPGDRPEPEQSGDSTVTVTICTESGQLAGPYCPDTAERTFPAGSAPAGTCTVHGPPRPAREAGSERSEPEPGPGQAPGPEPAGAPADTTEPGDDDQQSGL
ncbi:MAG: penicillin-binding transpeptidase domain-containing protein, partial [Armatimonadota bacterium]